MGILGAGRRKLGLGSMGQAKAGLEAHMRPPAVGGADGASGAPGGALVAPGHGAASAPSAGPHRGQRAKCGAAPRPRTPFAPRRGAGGGVRFGDARGLGPWRKRRRRRSIGFGSGREGGSMCHPPRPGRMDARNDSLQKTREYPERLDEGTQSGSYGPIIPNNRRQSIQAIFRGAPTACGWYTLHYFLAYFNKRIKPNAGADSRRFMAPEMRRTGRVNCVRQSTRAWDRPEVHAVVKYDELL
nr:hypothetical protein Iba_chr03cCG9930 [Ipomoea batatas]